MESVRNDSVLDCDIEIGLGSTDGGIERENDRGRHGVNAGKIAL